MIATFILAVLATFLMYGVLDSIQSEPGKGCGCLVAIVAAIVFFLTLPYSILIPLAILRAIFGSDQ